MDVVAILLAIFLAIRKSETRGEDGSSVPGVPGDALETWREVSLSAYTLGVRACFAKVIADFALAGLLRSYAFPQTLRLGLGVSLDVAWVAAMVVVWLRARRAGRLWAALVQSSAARRPSEGEATGDESPASESDGAPRAER